MRILVSAFACNPYGGSESGVGWRALCRIARQHEEVGVLVNPHHRAGWERGKQEGVIPDNIEVRFVEGNTACSRNRLIARFQSWLNYASFHRKVLEVARNWHDEKPFDLCHQVTIAGWRMPSPLWQLPIPFIWGPIGGAGHIPRNFRSMLSPSARIFEIARDVNSWWAARQTGFLRCMEETAVIFAANGETMEMLKPYRKGRPMIQLPIVSFPEEAAIRFRRPDTPREQGPLRLFAGGNIEGRKGVSLALKALAIVKAKGVDFNYTIASGGPDIPHLKRLAAKLGIMDQLHFHPGYQGEQYLAALHRADVYLLPSFRESTPVTLLESMMAGCHPVVADTGAQGEIVRLCGGDAAPAGSMQELVEGMADAIVRCSKSRDDLATKARPITDKVRVRFSSANYEETLRRAYAIALGQTTGNETTGTPLI